jgi:hypothetical protein
MSDSRPWNRLFRLETFSKLPDDKAAESGLLSFADDGEVRVSGSTMETTMFEREECSRSGCFLEAALPLIAPAVALFSMLSLLPCT